MNIETTLVINYSTFAAMCSGKPYYYSGVQVYNPVKCQNKHLSLNEKTCLVTLSRKKKINWANEEPLLGLRA